LHQEQKRKKRKKRKKEKKKEKRKKKKEKRKKKKEKRKKKKEKMEWLLKEEEIMKAKDLLKLINEWKTLLDTIAAFSKGRQPLLYP